MTTQNDESAVAVAAQALVNLAPVGLFVTDPSGRCTFVNPQWSRLTGRSLEEAQGEGWVGALFEDDRHDVLLAWRRTLAAGQVFATEYRIQTPEGRIHWVTSRATATHDESGQLTGYLVTIVDVTEIKVEQRKMWLELQEANRRLSEIATTDSLTGIANHFAFLQRLEQITLEAERGRPAYLLFVDIDHFKVFNDVHGHHAGDDVLRMVAQVVRQSVRRVDFVARYGGEEFVMILLDTSLEGAALVAERVRAAVQDLRHGYDQPITVSIGLCCHALGTKSVDQIKRSADKALYRAKRSGRNRVEIED
jgi:diguanylate cyclase (GGDEF)-like protein/PAS domain S-box-containing protein